MGRRLPQARMPDAPRGAVAVHLGQLVADVSDALLEHRHEQLYSRDLPHESARRR